MPVVTNDESAPSETSASRAAFSRSLDQSPPLLKLPSASECWCDLEVTVHRFPVPAVRFPPVAGPRAPRSSLAAPHSMSASSIERSSLTVWPSPGSSRSACPCPFGRGASPGVFGSPSAPSEPLATSPELPPPGTAHVHGFSPSSRAFFQPFLSGLVSSRKHSWGSPFRGFSSDVARSIRHRPLPSCRSHGGHRSLWASA
jgi:hypothetical protein